jgi:hypothetical protein
MKFVDPMIKRPGGPPEEIVGTSTYPLIDIPKLFVIRHERALAEPHRRTRTPSVRFSRGQDSPSIHLVARGKGEQGGGRVAQGWRPGGGGLTAGGGYSADGGQGSGGDRGF